MSKQILIFILFGLIGIEVFPQQGSYIQDYLPLNNMTGENIFFNRKDINPSLSNDSIAIKVSLIAHDQLIGFSNSPKTYLFSVAGEIPNTKSMLGLELGVERNGDLKNQLLKINYSYKIGINEKSAIIAGINLGLSRLKFDSYNLNIPGLITNISNWGYHPNIDIGLTYNILNQNIGLSYLGLVKSYIKSTFSDYIITDRIIVINYFSNYRLSSSLKIMPELVGFYDSYKTSLILKGILQYHEKLSVGFFMDNSFNTYGVMISNLFFKYFEIGYMFEHVKDDLHMYSYGSHMIKLGVLIK